MTIVLSNNALVSFKNFNFVKNHEFCILTILKGMEIFLVAYLRFSFYELSNNYTYVQTS
jgi:hypothetical protein